MASLELSTVQLGDTTGVGIISRSTEELSMLVEASVDAPRLSRTRLKKMRGQLEPRYEDVVLIVSELVSNSVRHGTTKEIHIKVTSSDNWIRVEVKDSGPGFSMDDPRGEGLGLAIVEKLSERWGMKDGQGAFTVWAELSAQST